MKNNLIGFLALCWTLCCCTATKKEIEALREGKILSLFSIVNFPNDPCRSQDSSARNGTCFTSSECRDKGGATSGNCAAGFGVCCIFVIQDTGGTINQNCTYIQNPGFPSAYSETTALTYTVTKCSDLVCAIRLDFDTFSILGPSGTAEQDATQQACQDSFTVISSDQGTSPVICGLNTGQHIYYELGTGNSATASLNFNFGSAASTIRQFEVKVTQIPCAANYRPPSGCFQYHEGLTGRFQTFNFQDSASPLHLANQNYDICIRQEDGYCCVQYSPCADPNSYTLDEATAAINAEVGTLCSLDYIEIDGVGGTCDQTSNAVLGARLCGTIFQTLGGAMNAANAVCDCTAPFTVRIVTNAVLATGDGGIAGTQRGVCFDYMQIPCS